MAGRCTFADSPKMSRLSPNGALNAEMLLQKAAAQTSLSDFGHASFREPFTILLRSLRDEARLNTQGVILMQRTMLRLLAHRLRTAAAFAAHPEMAAPPIERIDLRVGRIVDVWEHKESQKLYVVVVRGVDPRTQQLSMNKLLFAFI